jgi:biopolymer transport protein ExbB
MLKIINNAWRAVPRTGRVLAASVLLATLALQPAHAQSSTAATESVAVPGGNVTIAPVAAPSVDNPYGLGALWGQGDFVSKTTLIFLLLMSLGSWYVLVTRLRTSLQLDSDAREAREVFSSAVTLHQGAKSLRDGSAFRHIAEAGLHARERQAGSLTASIDRDTWLTMSVQRGVEQVQSRLQEGLAVLATVGSTAPFIGLFGTVWGIYHALTAIGIAGQASIDKVAGPVGEALIMTAIGLAVAVPAVLGYNWLVRRNKVTMDAVRSFSADIHAILASTKGAG